MTHCKLNNCAYLFDPLTVIYISIVNNITSICGTTLSEKEVERELTESLHKFYKA